MPSQPSGGRGLQVERTELSWERSSFGFLVLVGGALILLRQHGPLEVGRTMLALTAVLLALLILWLGHRRAQRIKASRVISGRIVVAAAQAGGSPDRLRHSRFLNCQRHRAHVFPVSTFALGDELQFLGVLDGVVDEDHGAPGFVDHRGGNG